MDESKCPICLLEGGDSVGTEDRGERILYRCERCGTFIITRTAHSMIHNGSKNYLKLSSWIRERNKRGESWPEITSDTLKNTYGTLPNYSVKEKEILLLKHIRDEEKHPGSKVLLIPHFDYPVAWATNSEEFRYYVQSFYDRKFISYRAHEQNLEYEIAFVVVLEYKGREYLEKHSLALSRKQTGWVKVDRYIDNAQQQLESAKNGEDFQAVGHHCREALISLADEVYNPDIHGPVEKSNSSVSDAKNKLEAYITKEVKGGSNKDMRKQAKATLDLASTLLHKKTADQRTASSCVEATAHVVKQIEILSGCSQPADESVGDAGPSN